MKIVIVPDSYKESLTALEVATQIEAGFREIFPEAEYIKLPVADGGEGTVEAMLEATAGIKITTEVLDPLGQRGPAFLGISGDGCYAIIEMAAASGLERVPVAKRNPLLTTSYGTGELITAALDQGVKHCIIGIGGSATNDGGAGMLQALGVKLLDDRGQQIGFGGAELARLQRIDISGLDARIKQCRIEVACDVSSPLTGEKGASAVFGPQKGATAEMIVQLDDNLKHYAAIIRRDLAIDVENVPGAGAAGGMGAALLAFLGAELRPGIDIVMQAIGLEAAISDADLVITGEGRIDSQTVNGKVPVGVARVAKKYNKPTIAIGGSLSKDVGIIHQYGVDAVFSVLHSICTLDQALEDAADNVRMASRNIAMAYYLGTQAL